MKLRRVLITMEVETNINLKKLRDIDYWNDLDEMLPDYTNTAKIIQIQANVIKKEIKK